MKRRTTADFDKARTLLREFKGDKYVFGTGVLATPGQMAASLGQRAALVRGTFAGSDDRVGIIRKGVLVEVADKATLMNRSLYLAHIHFKEPVDAMALANVPGVKILDRENDRRISLQVEGEMDLLIKALAAYPVMFFESERPSLEEIFLSYYEADRNGVS